MAAPTNADYVKKALANSEPSTHGSEVNESQAAIFILLSNATMLAAAPLAD